MLTISMVNLFFSFVTKNRTLFHKPVRPSGSFCFSRMANGVDHSFSDRWPSFWGDKTSNMDWCEENYLYSQYIAEFCKQGHEREMV